MEQDTNRYQTVADFLAYENRANAERKDVEVRKGSRENKMVYISDRGNRRQDQRDREPGWSDGSHIPPQGNQQWDPLAKSAQLDGHRISTSLTPPGARWSLGHRRSLLLQSLWCRDPDPSRKWFPIHRR